MFIKRVGNAVVLMPVSHLGKSLVASLELFSSDFLASRERPEQRRDDLRSACKSSF